MLEAYYGNHVRESNHKYYSRIEACIWPYSETWPGPDLKVSVKRQPGLAQTRTSYYCKNDVTVIVRNYISHKFLIVLVQNV